jgi:mono/diheme cytochrome c family protein
MNHRLLQLGVLTLLALVGAHWTARHGAWSPALAQDAKISAASKFTYEKDVRPFLKKHCFSCHGNGKSKADLSFDKFKDDKSVVADRKTWDGVRQMLEKREMPPAGRPKPETAEIDAVLKAVGGLFDEADRGAKPNVGRVTMRRLNRTEYNNTIRDLIGVDFKPAEDFPADDVGYGFDNIGDVLSVSPLLLEKYLSAAETILEQAIVLVDVPKLTKQRFEKFRPLPLTSAGEVSKVVSFDQGDYRIRCVIDEEDQPGAETVPLRLRVAGEEVKHVDVKQMYNRSILAATVFMKPGISRVAISLQKPLTGKVKGEIHLRSLEVEGPFSPPPITLPETHTRIMTHKEGLAPREAAREIVARFAARAFRRPVQPAEVERCLTLFDASQKKGQRFELSVRAALYRVMVSPHFLFRVELDPPSAKADTPYLLNEFELASRLSYFLWNSMPDEELFSLAGKGELRKNLLEQVRRMTKDAKSASFLENFAEQWLTLRKLDLASPDPKLFPGFDAGLRQAMIRESQLFFEFTVRDNRSVLDLLDADYTFVNEPLAKHYGIGGVKGDKFVRVKAPPGRGGILTHASILTLTSNATRSSPVKRGKFVLEQVLNTPPPPPPEDVPELEDQKELKGTLRQVMEQHRANAVCASCHRRMDPLGFAFENFDAVGAWRDKEGGAPVDASGELPDGRTFKGPDGLKALLRQNNRLFVRCLSEKMLTYALGRGLEPYDRRAVDRIVDGVTKDDYRFATLIAEIIKSDPFQMRMPGDAR